MASQYVSTGEAALMMKCTVKDVDRYIQAGLLDRYRLREKYIRVRRDQVEELAQVDPELLAMA